MSEREHHGDALGADIAEAVRREIERLRDEAATRARETAGGVALLGAAGGLGLLSAGALASLPLLALRRVLPGWAIALLVAGAGGGGAALFARAGVDRLAAAAPESVQSRIEEAKGSIVDVLRARARGLAG